MEDPDPNGIFPVPGLIARGFHAVYKSTVFYTYTIYLYILDTSMSSIGYISMCWMHIYIYIMVDTYDPTCFILGYMIYDMDIYMMSICI